MTEEDLIEYINTHDPRRRWECVFLACAVVFQLCFLVSMHLAYPHMDPFRILTYTWGQLLMVVFFLWELVGVCSIFFPDRWWIVFIKINYIILSSGLLALLAWISHFTVPLIAPLFATLVPVWIIVGLVALFRMSHSNWLCVIKWSTMFMVSVVPVILFLLVIFFVPQLEQMLSNFRHATNPFQQ